MRSARVRTAATLAAAAALLVVCATAASAGDGDPRGGLWYYDVPDFDTIHQQTLGQGITVGVMDSSINPAAPDLVGTNLTVHEPSYCGTSVDDSTPVPAAATGVDAVHATRMASIVVGNGAGMNGHPGTKGIAPQAKVIAYAFLGHEKSTGPDDPQCPTARGDGHVLLPADVIDQALADHVNILNMSWGGGASDPYFDAAVARAEHAGMILVAATPDEGGIGHYAVDFPANVNGVVAVAGMSASGGLDKLSTQSDLLTVVAPGDDFNLLGDTPDHYALISGSSNATAFTSAALALVWSKYPKATANQILWDLVTNTDSQDHPLQRSDKQGFGVVNVRHMLAHDPTTYPDTNPLVSDAADRKPSAAMIANPPTSRDDPLSDGTPSPTATADHASAAAAAQAGPGDASTGASAAAGSRSSSSTALVLGGVAALVVLGGVVAAAVLARRRISGVQEPEPVPARSAGASHDD